LAPAAETWRPEEAVSSPGRETLLPFVSLVYPGGAGAGTIGGSAAREPATRQHANPETVMSFRSVFIPAPPRDVGRLI